LTLASARAGLSQAMLALKDPKKDARRLLVGALW
jgi:hypothetical protein